VNRGGVLLGKKEKKYGGRRGSKSVGHMGSMAGPVFLDAEYSLHVSCLLAYACHQLYW